jgi:hypothetical protein
MSATLNTAEWVSAIATAVIGIATIIYVAFTRGLWRETKKSADAAAKSAEAAAAAAVANRIAAEAAKQAADMAAELNGPSLGVEGFQFLGETLAPQGDGTISHWRLEGRLRNFGNLRACGVVIEGAAYFDTETLRLNDIPRQGPLEIAPEAECPIRHFISISTMHVKAFCHDRTTVRLNVKVGYSSPTLQRRWLYTATLAVSQQPDTRVNFPLALTIEKSDTQALPG